MVQEFDRVQIRTGGKYEKHMYYRRPRNGEEQASWIVVAGTNAGRIQDMTARGFEPLFQYGTIEDWEKRTGQYINDLGPMGIWRPLLERGGAKEFPAEQVIIARWYKESPLPGRDPQDLFPQLKGHTLKEYQCPACKVAPFLKQDGKGGLDHLAAHLTISHGWTLDMIFKYGERSGIDFQNIYVHEEREVRFGEGAATPDCDECDYTVPAESKNKAASLRMHKMGAHKPLEVEVA